MEWISVEERWPVQWTRVLVWDGLDVEVTRKSDTLRSIWTNGNAAITHWMPLPAPPKGAASND
jgi:hypothetical protein